MGINDFCIHAKIIYRVLRCKTRRTPTSITRRHPWRFVEASCACRLTDLEIPLIVSTL
jgi:hypothetical protein